MTVTHSRIYELDSTNRGMDRYSVMCRSAALAMASEDAAVPLLSVCHTTAGAGQDISATGHASIRRPRRLCLDSLAAGHNRMSRARRFAPRQTCLCDLFRSDDHRARRQSARWSDAVPPLTKLYTHGPSCGVVARHSGPFRSAYRRSSDYDG